MTDSQLQMSISLDTLMLSAGKSVDVTVKVHTTTPLGSPVVMSLRSPGNEPLPDGLAVSFDPPALIPTPGQDQSTRLHLLADTRLSDDTYPLVVYGRAQGQEATTSFQLQVGGADSNWHRPISTPGTEQVAALGGDHGGGVFLAVNTTNAFGGLTNAGDLDGYVFHYKSNGAVGYLQSFRTAKSDVISALAVDADDSVYIAGFTYGAFPAQSSAGKSDAFLAKLGSDGKLAWLQQFGTSENDQLTGVAIGPDGTVYATGLTEGAFLGQTNAGASDVFLASFSPDGKLGWISEFGTAEDERTNGLSTQTGASVTVDGSGNVYVAGSTQGSFPGATSMGLGDGFVTRFDASGKQVWLQQIGSYADDALLSIAAHANGQIYAAGWARGPLPGQIQQGGQDGLVVAYRSDGSRAFVRQLGTSYADAINNLSIVSDQLYIVGSTRGTFPGQSQEGVQDLFYSRLGTDGTTLWLHQLGTSQSDSGVAIGGSGQYLYLAGTTFGDFATDTALTESDGFLNQYPLE